MMTYHCLVVTIYCGHGLAQLLDAAAIIGYHGARGVFSEQILCCGMSVRVYSIAIMQ